MRLRPGQSGLQPAVLPGMFTANRSTSVACAAGQRLPGQLHADVGHRSLVNALVELTNVTDEQMTKGIAAVTSPGARLKTPRCWISRWAVYWRRRRSGNRFHMSDIDEAFRKAVTAKVAPSTQKYHMEDVHAMVPRYSRRVDRAGRRHRDAKTEP